ncbi:hypothetical protein DI272_16315 [Streptomyces sp. Act143]|uniref:hypothetical protein n=1 Tax=Streptomyces sp. Act143 TaxID=2200760 RepID=UPI000D6780CA|nr:hypothetical protein [Streptomyces sp. Act143]PWI15562.1 hypothetical protein DI272_16315 [Streptomyces sp. Act143]
MAGVPDGGRGTKDDGRQAVLSALPPDDTDTVVITGISPGLQVQFTHPPVADWLCACGHHERARGKAAVIELTTRVRVGHCPHRTTPAHERRNAA